MDNRILLQLRLAIVFFGLSLFCLSPSDLLAQGGLEPPNQMSLHLGVIKQKEDSRVELRFQRASSPLKLVTREVDLNYTVQVPYVVKEMKEGREVNVTKTRTETRTKRVEEEVLEHQPLITLDLKQIEGYSSTGARISTEALARRIVDSRPVIVVDNLEGSFDYLSQILSDDALLVKLPKEYSYSATVESHHSPIWGIDPNWNLITPTVDDK